MANEKATRRARFGGVRQLQSGRWQARYGRDGRTYTGANTFETEADAWDYLATVEAAIILDEWQPPKRATPTLATYGSRWIDTHHKIRATTATLYRGDFDRHIEPYLGHMQLRAISTDIVREWLAQLRADLRTAAEGQPRRRRATRQDGSATTARCYRLLRAIMAAAVQSGHVKNNPCTLEGADEASDDGGIDERPTLSAAEVAMLADKVPDRYRALVLVLAWCGLRIGEATALRREDIDLTPGAETIRVSERVYWVKGKGWDFGPPKSKAGRRRVSVPPHVARALADHLARFTADDYAALVFTTRSGAVCRRVAYLCITRRLDEIGRDDVRVHDLRHTGNTLAAIAGASPAELMRRMGHSSTAASQAYIHTAEDHGRAIAERLAEIAEGANVVPLESRRRRRASAG